MRRIDIFCRTFDSLPFDDELARRYGLARTRLHRAGRLIGANDLMIASIAVAGSHLLITRNAGECWRGSGLSMEAW